MRKFVNSFFNLPNGFLIEFMLITFYVDLLILRIMSINGKVHNVENELTLINSVIT